MTPFLLPITLYVSLATIVALIVVTKVHQIAQLAIKQPVIIDKQQLS